MKLLTKDFVLEARKEDKREKRVAFTEDGKKYAENLIQPLVEAEERIMKKYVMSEWSRL